MRSKTERILYGGLITGLIGYGTVVILLALFNIVAGRSPFYTVTQFGNALFGDPAETGQIAAAPVLMYNALHLAVFLAVGVLASWLVTLGEEYPLARYLLFFVLLLVAAQFYMMLVFFVEPMLGGMAWLQIGIPSLVAAILMGWYLLASHPVLRRTLKDTPLGE